MYKLADEPELQVIVCKFGNGLLESAVRKVQGNLAILLAISFEKAIDSRAISSSFLENASERVGCFGRRKERGQVAISRSS